MFNDKINVAKKNEYPVVHLCYGFWELCKMFCLFSIGQYLFSVGMNIDAHWHSTANKNRKKRFESLMFEACAQIIFIHINGPKIANGWIIEPELS